MGLDGVIDKELTLSEEDKTQLHLELAQEKQAREKLEADVSNLRAELKKELTINF